MDGGKVRGRLAGGWGNIGGQKKDRQKVGQVGQQRWMTEKCYKETYCSLCES